MKSLLLKINSHHSFHDLVLALVDLGFERGESLLRPGNFSVQGGLVSVFPTNTLNPYKIDFFGDQIEQILEYDLKSGNKIAEVAKLEICANVLQFPDGSRVRAGGYVVHEDYGIGVFKTIGVKPVGKEQETYIHLEYLNGDMLYVPIKMLERLSAYIGVGRKKPKLSKLGSITWQKTYKKTYENVLHLARELLQLYAQREVLHRPVWKIDAEWKKAIEGSFPYRNTKDQDTAIADVYHDLAGDTPMDRLICGDVGFGKTEVAIRGMAQAVANGYQVALLVPTTILAEQHYVTLEKRFRDLPVSIERLSRFIDAGKQKETIQRVKEGAIDILIGTHRLLSEDLDFKNLGLLIIDEEQRFGVKHKERLKKFKTVVDVLTLSATPIPRTLFMSLSGIRDISQINTPPGGRKEIETRVSGFKDDLVKQYIEREIDRGGQVYYLHNEVSSIGGARNRLQKQFPKLRIEVAHGQMGEEKLAETMRLFAEGEIDLLVCSTIIENGLDLANVNTLIVEQSDRFGLSQLYQIRGRIGRSPKLAYALFTYNEKNLTPNAFKRLKALTDNTELGSGFNIALSDLEIRGGGNVLGREQHGNMETIGLVLYSKLLKLAVERLRKSGSF